MIDQEEEGQESIPISALEHYSYCPRQCALIHVEQVFQHDLHTTQGTIIHERVDEPTQRKEHAMRVERALPLWSHTFGLVGRADIVEFHEGVPYPVEYKRGAKRAWQHEAIQVCAQAFCLEEMFGVTVPAGAIYYCASRTRREILFEQSLRRATGEMIEAVRRLLADVQLPEAVQDHRCDHCSLKEVCLPEAVRFPARLRSYSLSLFHVQEENNGSA